MTAPHDQTNDPTQHMPRMPFARMLGVLTLAVLLTCLAACGIALATGRQELVLYFVYAAALSLLGGLVSLDMVRRAARISQEKAALGLLTGIGARLIIAAGGALLLVGVFGLPRQPVLAALLVGYLLVLIVEVRLLAGYFRSPAMTVPTPAPSARTEAGTC